MPLLRPTAPESAPAAPTDRRPAKVPDDGAIAGLIGELLDRKVAVSRNFGDYEVPAQARLATFADDDGHLAAVAAADLGFVAHTGASLALIPVATSELAVSEGEVPAALEENFYEVVNIMASLFNVDPSSHVKLTATHALGAPGVPPEASTALSTDTKPHWFDVSIDGYGEGTLAFFVV